MTMEWKTPQKPADFAEKSLIRAILEGIYPVESHLPSERVLCEQLGVTRPTLREALQRLSRDGWLDIQQGKSTRVRSYLDEGNLNVLNSIASAAMPVSKKTVGNLLEVRALLAPAYFQAASQINPQQLIHVIENIQPIPPESDQIGLNDWQLHQSAASLSGNPVYRLILNGFEQVYLQMSRIYFSQPEAVKASRDFYQQLTNYTKSGDHNAVFRCTTEVMLASITFWRKIDWQEDEE